MAIVLITRHYVLMSWWHYVLMSWWHYVQVWKVRGPTLDTRVSRDPVPRPKMEKTRCSVVFCRWHGCRPRLEPSSSFMHQAPRVMRPMMEGVTEIKVKEWSNTSFLACSDIYTRWFVNLRLSGGVPREGLCTCPWSPTWPAAASTKPSTDNPDLTPATRSSPSVKLINLWLFLDRRRQALSNLRLQRNPQRHEVLLDATSGLRFLRSDSIL